MCGTWAPHGGTSLLLRRLIDRLSPRRSLYMSYKVNLSDLDREGDVSLTKQLVDRFIAAIESGVLEPAEKLPPTRKLAEEVGVNHLTAARAYRRLAELGYVSATVGRGTFVRSLPPVTQGPPSEDWQIAVLPARTTSWRGGGVAGGVGPPPRGGGPPPPAPPPRPR